MIKLYCANVELVENKSVFDQLLEKVNEQRRSKVLRCKNEEDKQCSLLAGVLLRYGLEQMGLDYNQLKFEITPEKKPILKSHPEIHFSISHSGRYAVCLVSDKEIGVDIESKNRRLFADGQEERMMAVAKKSFSTQEYERFLDSSGIEQKELFLKYWTRKEAVSKAVGKGLAMDFSQIQESEDKFISFWLDEEYYASIYLEAEVLPKDELVIEMVNQIHFD